jgi:hypothetical protein
MTLPAVGSMSAIYLSFLEHLIDDAQQLPGRGHDGLLRTFLGLLPLKETGQIGILGISYNNSTSFFIWFDRSISTSTFSIFVCNVP